MTRQLIFWKVKKKVMKAATIKPEINMVLGKLSYWNVMGMVKRQDWHL